MFQYVIKISKTFDNRLDKKKKKKILKSITYIYLWYIYSSCKTDLISKKDGYFKREKPILLLNFFNLINELPWNIDQ
ncbi:hypothetical protein A0H76_974 [Hepatospora eriocheir]|uniref:Uncharacterized protein n=2 Tax=Hepatospora eriocheir TaxID=1081669 RepID=A0A1X0QKX1_9MICR|nr:hypothetical protein A0H76_974 [Hepatospora eriocheir]